MTLLPGLKQQLGEHFGCPVLDIYSMNEAGPIAVTDPTSGGHVLLQHSLYVEILDTKGRVLPPGKRGEITISGGFNFCLPLLRYRTGDYAALEFRGREPVLVGLEGRPPVLFRTMSGQMINNIEITHVLRPFAIPQFSVHQHRDGSLKVGLRDAVGEKERVRQALLELFGSGQELEIIPLSEQGDKLVQYTSEIEGTLA
jgi:phenylacetate-CoA ligase